MADETKPVDLTDQFFQPTPAPDAPVAASPSPLGGPTTIAPVPAAAEPTASDTPAMSSGSDPGLVPAPDPTLPPGAAPVPVETQPLTPPSASAPSAAAGTDPAPTSAPAATPPAVVIPPAATDPVDTSKPDQIGAALDAIGTSLETLAAGQKANTDNISALQAKAPADGAEYVNKVDLEHLQADLDGMKTSQNAFDTILKQKQGEIDDLTAKVKTLEEGDLDTRLGKVESALASGTGGAGSGARDFLDGAEMSAEALIQKVAHLWKQNGNA